MKRKMNQSKRINPEENIALGLQMLKTRLDNMPLTRVQRTELDEIISMIARHTGEVVKERTMFPLSGERPKKEPEKEKGKGKKE